MKNQCLPLPFATRRKPRPRKLKRPAKGSPVCENMLNRRIYVDDSGGLGKGCYDKLPAERCTHRGHTYKLNGMLTMVLCICCVRRIMRGGNVTIRQVREARKIA